MKTDIAIKRVYDEPQKKDGHRVLVDRVWPRGLTKEKAAVDEWAKDLAPTTELRKWFGHKPELWSDFRKKYIAELKKNEAVKIFISEHEHLKKMTLVYGAKDEEHNQAVVLKEFLEQ